jgi:hypothetical protein
MQNRLRVRRQRVCFAAGKGLAFFGKPPDHPNYKTGRSWDIMGFHGASMDSTGIIRFYYEIFRHRPNLRPEPQSAAAYASDCRTVFALPQRRRIEAALLTDDRAAIPAMPAPKYA